MHPSSSVLSAMASLSFFFFLPTPSVFLLLLLFFSLHHLNASPELTNFTLHGFISTDLTVDGSANVTSNSLLRLTDTNRKQIAHAFFTTPFPFRNPSVSSFSTAFVFAMVPTYPGTGTQGMAFLISPHNRIVVRPQDSQYLGLFTKTTDGNASNHIVAVEFDLTVTKELKDIDDNHVGIDVNSAVSIESKTAGYYSPEGPFMELDLLSGDPIQAWVEYNSSRGKLDVTLAPLNLTKRPAKPSCSAQVNLTGVLLDHMYLGFSGASGKSSVSLYVLGWSFRLNGDADPLDLSKLPKIPRERTTTGQKQPGTLMRLLPLFTAVIVVMLMGALFLIWRRREKYAEVLEEWELEYGPHRISYRDLYRATKGFKESEVLGTGGFGKVYRGVMPRSKAEVAVKRVSHDSRQGIREFVAEVASIGRLRHRNLVSLLGYCRRKGELLLVYDYMSNGSLDKVLFDDPKRPLDWEQRLGIIKGVATGLLYLHEEWEKSRIISSKYANMQVVLHRDVKASNVLLDGDWNGRLGDFGLARLYDHGTAPQTTHVVGTRGYLAPELARAGKASKATDVFAFGMFVMEVVCGRRPVEPRARNGEVVLVDWVVKRWVMDGGDLSSAADARLKVAPFKTGEVEMVMRLGLTCVQGAEEARPSMRQVVQMLEGNLAIPEMPMEYWKGCLGAGVLETGDGGGLSWTAFSGASSSAAPPTGSMYLSGGR